MQHTLKKRLAKARRFLPLRAAAVSRFYRIPGFRAATRAGLSSCLWDRVERRAQERGSGGRDVSLLYQQFDSANDPGRAENTQEGSDPRDARFCKTKVSLSFIAFRL